MTCTKEITRILNEHDRGLACVHQRYQSAALVVVDLSTAHVPRCSNSDIGEESKGLKASYVVPFLSLNLPSCIGSPTLLVACQDHEALSEPLET